MKYYKFKTFTTAYYFPPLAARLDYMYGLYSPYGGIASRMYWTLFKRFHLVRRLTAVEERCLKFPYDTIMAADGHDSLMSFNMGSPGVEQKISILGYDYTLNVPFFAKFAQTSRAMDLIRNEMRIYRLLKGTDLTPGLIEGREGDDFVYMKAEYVKGVRPGNTLLNERVLALCRQLSTYHIRERNLKTGLRYSLSHGDFCPWNMLENNGEIRLIDWEMADERPLGYDLFTFICQVSALFEPKKKLGEALAENRRFIDCFFDDFGIKDHIPYLYAFAQEKYNYEKAKGNQMLAVKFKDLYDIINYG